MAESKPKRLFMSRKPTDKGKHWTDRDRLKVVAAFSVLGNASRVEEVTGVPANTINYWKTLPWWFEEMDKLRKAEDETMISGYGKIMQKTIEKLEKRLEEGDIVILRDGTQVNKPVSAKELAYISTNATNSRQKIRGEAIDNAIKTITIQDRLKQLHDQFASFTKGKTIEGEVISKEIEYAEQDTQTKEDNGSSSEQPAVCEEGGNSIESSEGVLQSGSSQETHENAPCA